MVKVEVDHLANTLQIIAATLSEKQKNSMTVPKMSTYLTTATIYVSMTCFCVWERVSDKSPSAVFLLPLAARSLRTFATAWFKGFAAALLNGERKRRSGAPQG